MKPRRVILIVVVLLLLSYCGAYGLLRQTLVICHGSSACNGDQMFINIQGEGVPYRAGRRIVYAIFLPAMWAEARCRGFGVMAPWY